MDQEVQRSILTDCAEKTCPYCGNLLPTKQLFCVACAEKRALRGALQLVDRHLPDIAEDRLKLHVKRKHKNGEQHISLPNYHHAAFCGLDLRDHKNKELCTLREAMALLSICQYCVVEIDRRIAEAKETSPPWAEEK